MLGIVLAILSILIVLSGVLLSVRLVQYIKIDDKELNLTTNMDADFDLFSVEYTNAAGEITVSGTEGEAVVAPGTSVEYTIRLRNADKTALDYVLSPEVTMTSDYHLPIMIRMLDINLNYLIGDAKTWVPIEELTGLSVEQTLVRGESTEYYFQWKWEFESGDDAYDTALGIAASEEDVGLEVAFNLLAEANTEIGKNGGIMKSGLGDILFAGVAFVMLSSAIALNVILLVKKRKHEAA
jgi:hypothetical protein